MFLYDDLDHHHQTNRMGTGFYSGIFHAGGRRCEILHDIIMYNHVALQGNIMCGSLSCFWFRTDCGLDRYVL